MSSFSSPGFDLSALSTSDGVLESDGTVTQPSTTDATTGTTAYVSSSSTASSTASPPAAAAAAATKKEAHVARKEEGNSLFLAGDYAQALDCYYEAIEEAEAVCRAGEEDEDEDEDEDEFKDACPYTFNRELVELQALHLQHKQRVAARERRVAEELERERERARAEAERDGTPYVEPEKVEPEKGREEAEELEPPPEVVLPRLKDPLSKYHCNAAACLAHLGRWEECRTECDVAIAYDPEYIKAFIRRAKARENCKAEESAMDSFGEAMGTNGSNNEAPMGDIDGALADVKQALVLYKTKEPIDKNDKKQIIRLQSDEARLQKQVDAKMEKLKTETMGKLKDLGNSILGNFGLSMDNFSAVQDPNTGGYSISFNQNK